jgi:hypothetical protein
VTNHEKVISKTYLNREKFPIYKGMDLIQILENLEKFEHIDFKTQSRLKLTDEIIVLPWKRNYWQDYNTPLQDKPYHKRLRKLRKKIDHDEKKPTKRVRITEE